MAMILGLTLTMGRGILRSTAQPEGPLPADAYQQPLADGDEGYWAYQDDGYYQEPEP